MGFAWATANQKSIEEPELVLYALVALYHQYTHVGVPKFREAKQNFLTQLESVKSLDGLYILNSKGGPQGDAIAKATHACCPDFEKSALALNNWYARDRKHKQVCKTFCDTWFCQGWKAKLKDDESFAKLSAHLDQAIDFVKTESLGPETSGPSEKLDLKPFLDELNKEVLKLVGAYIPTTCVYTSYYVFPSC